MVNAGFNIYDADLGRTEDVMEQSPWTCRSNFDPRRGEPVSKAHAKRDLLTGSYGLTPGPLPADVSASVSQYVWSLNVYVPSESDMLKFCTMLSQCTRQEHFQKSEGLKQYMQEMAARPKVDLASMYNKGGEGKGYLEVLLVEARTLEERVKGTGAAAASA